MTKPPPMLTTIRLTALSCLILLSSTAILSCSKPHDAPPHPTPAPPPTDSLGAWQLLRDSTVGGVPAIDLWFTSVAKGFYLGLDYHIYQSADGGQTWTQIPGLTSPSGLENLFFVDAQHGFAQADKNLLVTRDGGSTWAIKQINGLGNLHFFFSSPSTGLSADASGPLFKTTDTGNTWTTVRSTDPAPGVVPWLFDDQHGILVSSGNGHVDTTQSGGSVWQNIAQISGSLGATSFNALQFVDQQHGFYASADGLFKTANGGLSWSLTHSGAKSINILQFSDANNGYYSADSAIYKTTDGGQTWTTTCKLVGGDRIYGMHFIDAHTGWAGTSKGLILHLQ